MCFSHSGGWEVQDQGIGRFGVWFQYSAMLLCQLEKGNVVLSYREDRKRERMSSLTQTLFIGP